MLTLAAFDQSVTVLFLDDAVFHLLKGVITGSGSKGTHSLWATLPFYGIDEVWVEQESLVSCGLDITSLAIPVKTIARRDVPETICRHSVVLAAI
jgi:tRNA 2-thiouridine synthesizing protein C